MYVLKKTICNYTDVHMMMLLSQNYQIHLKYTIYSGQKALVTTLEIFYCNKLKCVYFCNLSP
uniref:Uncharacterized protein n=1 Tax=Anguilla anguilla TaxID=7936 RepID=A0A0E9X885_ANGAN